MRGLSLRGLKLVEAHNVAFDKLRQQRQAQATATSSGNTILLVKEILIMLNQYQDNTQTTNLTIATQLAAVQERIHQAEIAASRQLGAVQLLAVSKTHAAVKIRAAYEAGQRAFGENYLQEALDKQEELQDLAIEWHFIGRIQSNKTKAIAENFNWVHGLGDINHARRLNTQRPHSLPPLNVCIQVNVSNELSKGGVMPEVVPQLLEQCMNLPRLRFRGLMAIPEPMGDFAQQRLPFERLRRLRDSLIRTDLPLDTLSMGMSDDLEAAIAEGATLVRIGTAIFGSRGTIAA